ncbi:PTS glucose transporter subunit IIA [Ferrimonas lipolytica]|uniref:PTS system glucose-specific EIIA component n=1 Tax=Ferrimonas lipolytica TaxID=2724191 RepID=A0A6H1UE24_9GAMM|nr:PTS glucose transporter subunit IIA [Ferrimonas lipolytica]QIZ76879.1 PTS glucose transporter subunit IIA [Ferrimonas lipolytica]
MGFLSRLRRIIDNREAPIEGVELVAPVSGKLVPIENVPDVVFSEKIVGDGVAIDPSGNQVVAPIDGTIGRIFDANHAFAMESPLGLEIFVHFGIDTVELRGTGFKRLAEEGQKVVAGEPILEFDLEYLKEHAKSVLTPVVIANMEDVKQLNKLEGTVEAGVTPILTIEL